MDMGQMQALIDQLRTSHPDWQLDDRTIAWLRDRGCGKGPTMYVIIHRFGVSIEDAKLIVHHSPVSDDTRAADEALHERLERMMLETGEFTPGPSHSMVPPGESGPQIFERRLAATFPGASIVTLSRCEGPMLRIAFGGASDARQRVANAVAASRAVRELAFADGRADVLVTVWRGLYGLPDDVGQALGQLGIGSDWSMHERARPEEPSYALGRLSTIDGEGLARLVAAIARHELGLEPSLHGSLMIARFEGAPIAVAMSEDRGLDVVSVDPHGLASIDRELGGLVYERRLSSS